MHDEPEKMMTSERKLRHHIAAVVMVFDHSYSTDRACELADRIINELGLRSERTPDFIITSNDARVLRKRCYRYTTDWHIQ